MKTTELLTAHLPSKSLKKEPQAVGLNAGQRYHLNSKKFLLVSFFDAFIDGYRVKRS
jgi:hypothetical protein